MLWEEVFVYPSTQVFLVPLLSEIAELPLCKLQVLSNKPGAGQPFLPRFLPIEGGGSQTREEALLFVLGGEGRV